MRLKNILLAIGMVSFVVPACAQKIDSLKALLVAAPDSEKAKILLDIAYEFRSRGDFQMCLKYAGSGYEYALHAGDSLLILRGGWMLGQAYRKINNLKESLKARFSQLCLLKNDFQCAADYQQKYIELRIAYTVNSS